MRNIKTYPKNQETELTVNDIVVFFAKYIVIISIPPFLCGLISIVYVLFFTTPEYTSISKIVSSSSKNDISQAAGLAAQFGINLQDSNSDMSAIYPEILKSRTIARSMLFKKINLQGYGEETLFNILKPENNKIKDIKKLESIMIENLLEKIVVNVNKRTGVLSIVVTAEEPTLAAEINRILIKELDNNQKDFNKNKTSRAKLFTEERIEEVRLELEKSEESLKVFNDRNRRIENSPSLQLERDRFSREVAVLTGVYTTLKQQLEKLKIAEVKQSDYVIIVDPPNIPLLKSGPKRKRIVILSVIFGIILGVLYGITKEYYKNQNKQEFNKLLEAKVLLFESIKGIKK